MRYQRGEAEERGGERSPGDLGKAFAKKIQFCEKYTHISIN